MHDCGPICVGQKWYSLTSRRSGNINGGDLAEQCCRVVAGCRDSTLIQYCEGKKKGPSIVSKNAHGSESESPLRGRWRRDQIRKEGGW